MQLGSLALTFTKVTLTRVVIVFVCDSRSVSRNRWHSNKQGGGRPSHCFTAVRLEKFLNPPSTAELRRRKTMFSFQESFAGLASLLAGIRSAVKAAWFTPLLFLDFLCSLSCPYILYSHIELNSTVLFFRWMRLLNLITKANSELISLKCYWKCIVLSLNSVTHYIKPKLKFNSIQFKIICIALFTIQSLQSSFTGN